MGADWRCARCGTAEGRNRRSFCCRACGAELAAAGLMWCGSCHQPRPLLHGKSRGMCRRCRSASEYTRKHGRRRVVVRPGVALPAGPDVWGQLARAWALLASDEWPGSLE